MVRISSVRRATRSGRIVLLICALACAVVLASAGQAMAVTFDPAKVISDDNFRAYDSMTQADIQAFLSTQPGVLATYRAVEYPSGKTVSASQIIFDACVHFHINPKVMLTMLQKEQSLLTRSKSSLITKGHATLDWALGMGCPDGTSSCMASGCHSTKSPPPDNRYPEYRGFGRQFWAACWSLDAYGEKGKTRPSWHHAKKPFTEPGWSVGATITIDGGKLKKPNPATYTLYTYNPSIGAKTPYGDLSKQASNLSGNANFWWIYRRYFGDTWANAWLRPVYRFQDTKLGSYLYTSSPAERYNLGKVKRYKSQGVAFSWDTSNTANNTPVLRFVNRKTGGCAVLASGTASASYLTPTGAKTWKYVGVVFKASLSATGTPVYQFNSKKTGLPFLTRSAAEKNKFLDATHRRTWAYKGIPYYLAP